MSALALTVVVVLWLIVGLIGWIAGGWFFILGFTLGITGLGLAAATSSRLRSWFAWADDQIDDEKIIERARDRGWRLTS